jgi:hypothetical protein
MRPLVLAATLLTLAACPGSSNNLSPVGASCVPTSDGQSTECADKLCLALDSASGICTKDCSKDLKCPEGFVCDSAGRFGLVCLKNKGCKTDDDCPAGHRCDTATNTCFIKVNRQLCSPCEDDAQCPQGGSCFVAKGSGERFCTAPCDANGVCPGGYACSQLPDGKTNQCLPVTESCNFGKSLCAPCKGDSECGNFLDLCVRNVVSGEQFCGRQCAPSRPEDCPSDFSCQDLSGNGKGPFQCVPNSNTCVGYCDSSDEHVQTIECGVGRTCDLSRERCAAANDGRQCSPCQTNDDCAKTGHEGNQCLVNNSPNAVHQGETFCAEPCPTDGGDEQCLSRMGPGFVCSQVGNQNFCTPVRGTCLAGLGRLGDDCAAHGADDCVTGVCIAAGEGSICSANCTLDTQCGDNRYRCCNLVTSNGNTTYDCSQRNSTNNGPASGQGICAPSGGAFGDDCSPGRPPCSTGACLDLGTAQLCTVLCPDGTTCPPDFTCQQALDTSLGPDAGVSQNVCFPQGGGVVGSDCSFGPAACADRLCITKDSGNICTKACSTQADCPTDYSCVPNIKVVGQDQPIKACIPASLQ